MMKTREGYLVDNKTGVVLNPNLKGYHAIKRARDLKKTNQDLTFRVERLESLVEQLMGDRQ